MTIGAGFKTRRSFSRCSFLGTTAWAALGMSPAFSRGPNYQAPQGRGFEWPDGIDAAA